VPASRSVEVELERLEVAVAVVESENTSVVALSLVSVLSPLIVVPADGDVAFEVDRSEEDSVGVDEVVAFVDAAVLDAVGPTRGDELPHASIAVTAQLHPEAVTSRQTILRFMNTPTATFPATAHGASHRLVLTRRKRQAVGGSRAGAS
jgi:hypothetical protein